MVNLESPRSINNTPRYANPGHKIQYRDHLEGVGGDLDDRDIERRQPTHEEIARMDMNLSHLSALMKNSEARWAVDGGLAISLLTGEYIGIHKDIDISIEKEDLKNFNTLLKQNGYDLFTSYTEEIPNDTPSSRKVMEAVNVEDFEKKGKIENLIIAAVNESGVICENVPLNFLDVHIVQRNTRGNPYGACRTELPEEWFTPKEKLFHKIEIHFCHPAKIAYFKLHRTRAYDTTDLHKLAEAGSLTRKHIKELKRVLETTEVRKTKLETAVAKILENSSASNIFEILTPCKDVLGADDNTLMDLSDQIAEHTITKESLFKQAYAFLPAEWKERIKEVEEIAKKQEEFQ